jgi:hypothetical protein
MQIAGAGSRLFFFAIKKFAWIAEAPPLVACVLLK